MFPLNLDLKIIVIVQQVGGMKISLPVEVVKWAIGMKRSSTPVAEALRSAGETFVKISLNKGSQFG